MACNSDKCHCPACNEERRLKSLETRVAMLELHTDDARDILARDRDWRGKRLVLPHNIGSRRVGEGPRGPVYMGWHSDDKLMWRWKRSFLHPNHWRRVNIRTEELFGSEWSNHGRPITPWGSPTVSNSSVTLERSEHKRVGQIERTVTDRVIVENNPTNRSWIEDKFGEHRFIAREAVTGRWSAKRFEFGAEKFMNQLRNSEPVFDTATLRNAMRDIPKWHDFVSEKLERPKMTPTMIHMLMRAYTEYPGDIQLSHVSPSGLTAAQDLRTAGILDFTRPEVARLTSKGRVLAEAILNLPEPVQAEPEWKMPPRS